MIIGWPGIEHSFTILRPIPGSLISMTIVQTHYLFGFTTARHGLGIARQFFLLKPKKDGIFGKRTPHLWNHTLNKYNFFGLSTLLGSLVRTTAYKIIYLIHFHFLWYEFIKSNGRINTKRSYAVKKMWCFSVRPKSRSLSSQSPCIWDEEENCYWIFYFYKQRMSYYINQSADERIITKGMRNPGTSQRWP